jgi:excisionase family DNA binding protein
MPRPDQSPSDVEVLSPTEAANVLKVDRKTIFALLAKGLRHQRLGSRIIRIRRDDLLAFGQVVA